MLMNMGSSPAYQTHVDEYGLFTCIGVDKGEELLPVVGQAADAPQKVVQAVHIFFLHTLNKHAGFSPSATQ